MPLSLSPSSPARRSTSACASAARPPVFDEYMQQSSAWQAVRRWRGHPFVAALRQAALAAYPDLVAELDGIAAGVGWPAEDIFLWNCRGELIHNAPDGCTTLAARDADGTRWIAHNEDGDPYLRERCLLVDVQPAGKPGFISFYYPGSLPGHTLRRTARASRRRSTTCGSARRQQACRA